MTSRLAGAIAFIAGLFVAAATALRLGGDWLPIRGASFFAAAWASALLGSGLYGLVAAAPWRRVVGMALLVTPLMFTTIGIINTIPTVVAGGAVLEARSTYQLSGLYIGKLLRDLGYLGVGFILFSGWRPQDSLHGLARRLRESGVPVGRSERDGAVAGFAWFPVLLFGTIAVDFALRGAAPQLVNSDETSVWANMTPFHAVMISAAASVGEEAVYRLLLMGGLAVLLGRAGWGRHAAWGTALVLQALVFGFAHGGYGNWLHIIQAGLFGLIAGVAVLLYGIWGAVMLHFLVDIYAIGIHADTTWWLVAIAALLLVNVGYSLYRAGGWAWGRIGRRKQAA